MSRCSTFQYIYAFSLFLLSSYLVLVKAEKQCATYSQSTCLFGEIDTANALCYPIPCKFDTKQAYECGFAETGTYTYDPEPASGCKDPFMSMHRGRPRHCGERCCDTTLYGKFISTPALKTNTYRTGNPGATRYSYQPIDSECRYDEITRGQLLHYLHSIDGAITVLTVIGDSMMRQFFLRLVMMFRGQERLLDYHIRTHVQYHVCKEADSFRVTSPTPDGSTGEEHSQHLRDVVKNGFFTMQNGAGMFNTKQTLAKCSHLPRELHFLSAPLYSSQNALLPLYMDSLPVGVKPVIVTAVGYWENPAIVPEKYLNTLLNLTDHASKVVIVSVPTAKVNKIAKSPDKPSQFEVITTRNRFMKEWVDEQQQQQGNHPNKFLFLDLDAMSQAENRPPLPAGADKHYMCSLWWESSSCKTCPPVIIDEKSSLNNRPQIPQGSIKKIQVPEDGECADEMQRNAWQVLLNALIGTHYKERTEV